MEWRFRIVALVVAGAVLLSGGLDAAQSDNNTTTAQVAGMTLDDWKFRRLELVREWRETLGTFPERPALNLQIVSTTTESDHIRKLVRYQTEKGVWTDAFLLVPPNAAFPTPAAVVFHGTSKNHILQPAGLADAPTRHLALHLVRRGYIAIAPRCFIYGEADESATTCPATPEKSFADYQKAAGSLLSRKPGWTGMGKMLWDGMRAVDVLESLPEVNRERIICAGHSLGAKQSLYLAAFDERIRAAVFSEGGVGLKQSNWEAPWYLGQRMPDPAKRDHDQLLQLIAPRVIIIAGGGSADGPESAQVVARAIPVFQMYSRKNSLVLQMHQGGHDFPDSERIKAFELVDRLVTRPE